MCVCAQRGEATISHFWISPLLNYNRCSLAMEMNGRRRAESWLDKYVQRDLSDLSNMQVCVKNDSDGLKKLVQWQIFSTKTEKNCKPQ